MSMPKFPDIDPDMTCDRALNMILASIAMEELALSHILNAEGEKLQYVLGTLESSSCMKPTTDEVLEVNRSITNLLDSVSQNQMILKSKMDKALYALSCICPGRPGPPGPPGPSGPPGRCPCKCSASFKSEGSCRLWRAGCALPWSADDLHGKCFCCDPCDKSKIELLSKGRFVVHFSANVKSKACSHHEAAISLQMLEHHQRTDVHTVHAQVSSCAEVTMAMGGVLIEVSDHHRPSAITFTLISPESLAVENAKLSIIEI